MKKKNQKTKNTGSKGKREMGWLLERNVGSREGFPPSDGFGGPMSRSHSRERSRCYRREMRSPSEGSLEGERDGACGLLQSAVCGAE